LIEGYDGTLPFHQYLKTAFAKKRNYGSTDRRIYRSWCYAWFRIGKTIPGVSFFERLTAGYFLVHGCNDEMSTNLCEMFIGDICGDQSVAQLNHRIEIIQKHFPGFKTDDLFPFESELSADVSRNEFSLSMLKQPKVFIRVVSGKEEIVKSECRKHGILYEQDKELTGCFAFESSVSLGLLPGRTKGYFEIQDRSSQVAGAAAPLISGEKWWDCCCGAGGKTLQMIDRLQSIHITATDKRESILKNLLLRIGESDRNKIETDIIDLEFPLLHKKKLGYFDGIVADVPCSGSGTWARTPEKLTFFKDEDLLIFPSRQKSIIDNVTPHLKRGGKFLYITCSVFRSENEEIAHYISEKPGFRLVKQELVDGMSFGSDSMFYALFEYN